MDCTMVAAAPVLPVGYVLARAGLLTASPFPAFAMQTARDNLKA
jgi:hypothetical protein